MLGVTFTTVNFCRETLESYVLNFKKYGHYDVNFVVIGDLKTPPLHNVAKIIQDQGFSCEYWDIRKQKDWLKQYPKLAHCIPYNSDNRRNIGYLRATELGCEIVVSIDDDNFALLDEDFYKYHSIVGTEQKLKSFKSSNSWFNPCSLLVFNGSKSIYMRGFPLSKRFDDRYSVSKEEGHVVLNMGLWLGDPDVNAFTNLTRKSKVIDCRAKEQIMLKPNIFAPINSQNTAFHRSILPCYYYILMDLEISGLKLGRYGDIWQGFFTKKVIDTVGDRVTVGRPLTIHRRNEHDFIVDLKREMLGIIINERMVDWLKSIEISSKNYCDAYLELSEILEKDKHLFGTKTTQKYFSKVAKAMKAWINACEKVM